MTTGRHTAPAQPAPGAPRPAPTPRGHVVQLLGLCLALIAIVGVGLAAHFLVVHLLIDRVTS